MQPFIPHDLTLTERILVAIGPLWRFLARRFEEAFAVGEPAPPHPSAMLREHNWAYRLIFPRFFKRISVDEAGVERISEAAAGATVVYVTKYVGQLEYNYFNHLFLERGLPKAAYCNALTVRRWMRRRPWWRSIARQEKEIEIYGRPIDPLVDGTLPKMIAGGDSVMLRIPQTDLEEESVFYSTPLRGLGAVIDAQRKTEKPILLVPIDFLWSRRPPKAKRSLVDILFGESDQPGRIRKFALFWRNYKRRAQASLGAPIDVRALVAANPEASTEHLVQALRQTLRSTIRLQRRTITGPTVKPRSEVIAEVLSDDQLDEAICRIAADRGKPADDVRDLAHKYAKEIVADLDYTYVELLERLLGGTLVRLFESLNVDTEGLERAKELFGKGPVVFVPNHKSHADYLVLSYVLYHHGMNIPHIAAGKNLSFWPLGRIFRRCGAFFIRRSFKGNDLYEAVLQTYLKVLLKEGHSQEFFIEGGRSRTGLLRNPRTGMLRMLQRAARDGGVDNMNYIPIAITYDRVIEQRSYVKELSGGQKVDERPSQLLSLTKFVRRQKSSYGSIYIRFGEPIPYSDVGDGPEAIEGLAQEICHEINRNVVVTPASVAAAAMLSSTAQGMAFPEFRERAQAIIDCLTYKGVEIPKKLAESPHSVLKDAVDSLSGQKLVQAHYESLEPFVSLEESRRIPLSYFRNGIVHYLVSTGVVCRLIRAGTAKGKAPTLDELESGLAGAKELLLRQHRFATSQPLREHARKVLGFLEGRGAVRTTIEGAVQPTEGGLVYMKALESQVLPSVERLWIAARVVLERMKAPMEERALLEDLLQCGGDMYLLGKVRFREAVTRDGLMGALETLVGYGLLRREAQRPGAKEKKRAYAPTGDAQAAARLMAQLEKIL